MYTLLASLNQAFKICYCACTIYNNAITGINE